MRNIFKAAILLLMILSLGFSLRAEEKMVIRFDNPDRDILETYLSSEQYDVAAFKPGNFLDLVVTRKEYDTIKQFNPEVIVTQIESQLKYNVKSKDSKDLAGYRNYTELLSELQQLATDYPDICKLYDIGDSWGKTYADSGIPYYDNFNHEIWALKVSDNVAEEEDEPSVYFFGEHHAREPISLEVVMSVLHELVDNYGTNQKNTARINNSQIWFVPLVNPDGHKIVLDETDIWWRKNLRDNNNNHQIDTAGYMGAGQDGVDINRNYGFQWGAVGTSDNPADELYNGPQAWSEPEIQSLKSLLESHHFVTGISYHSYGEWVLYPYAYNEKAVAPDIEALSQLAVEMAEVLPAENGGNYDPYSFTDLGPGMGILEDYSYGQQGIFSYCVEVGTKFIPEANQVQNICDANLEAATMLLDRTTHSMVTGHVTDQVTKGSVIAEVFVEGIDDSNTFREPYKSDEQFGRFYRLLKPGNYNITFSAYGYLSQTVSDVNISASGVTDLEVTLVRAETFDISGSVIDEETNQPISNASITVEGAPFGGITNENGEYLFEDVIKGTYTFKVSADEYTTLSKEMTINGDNTVINFVLNKASIENFETGDFSLFDWTFEENTLAWETTTNNPFEGTYCARSKESDAYRDSSKISLTLELEHDGYISFRQKVSSELDYDFLMFYIDGELKDKWSGDGDWTLEEYFCSAGTREFEWKYETDWSGTHYENCAYIDDIQFPKVTTSINNNDLIVNNTVLLGNYPNPFNPETQISFSTAGKRHIKLSIYNSNGQFVKELVNKEYEKGVHKINFNGSSLNSGVYYYKLEAENGVKTVNKMLLIK